MKKLNLKVKEVEGKKFYFVDFGSEVHGRSSFRLWVHYSLVEKGDDKVFISFPKRGVKLEAGKSKDTVVMRPGDYVCFLIFVSCGYRGSSDIEILNGSEVVSKFEFFEYSSPRGNLGVSKGLLVCVKGDRVYYKWERTGRTYGAPKKGLAVMYVDGRIEEVEKVDSLCEVEDLAEVGGEMGEGFSD